MPVTHLGHAAAADIAERVELAMRSVVQCAWHLMPNVSLAAVERAAYEAMKNIGIQGLDRLQGVSESAEEFLARGTGTVGVVP